MEISLTDGSSIPSGDPGSESGGEGNQFGTFGGVFTPSILTILGVVMYLLLPEVTGRLGLFQTLMVVVVAHIISFSTGLSVSSIATNRTVGAGGAYYMISRSLGAPAGAAIGIPLFFAQALSVTFYIVGFSVALGQLFPILNQGFNPILVGTATNVLLTALSMKSADLALKVQYLVMVAILLSLGSFFTGTTEGFGFDQIEWANTEKGNFVQVFAVFFPAVTGIMAGVSMSGDLKDARRSIPKGTLAAIFVGFLVYMAFPIWLAMNLRNADLVSQPDAVFLVSSIPILIYVGVWGATLSSALGSILTAPRTLQALALDGLAPRILGRGYGPNSEPRLGVALTFVMSQTGILLGSLDAIAPVLTMFFLVTYGFTNLACGLEKWAASPSFRPTFKLPATISLLGALGCFYVMSLINFMAMVASLIICSLIFVVAQRRAMTTTYGDARHGIWAALVRSALHHLRNTEFHPLNWRPNLVILGGDPKKRAHLLHLGNAIVQDRGIVTYFHLLRGALKDNHEERKALSANYATSIAERFPSMFYKVDVVDDIYRGTVQVAQTYGIGNFECNTVMLGWPTKTDRNETYVQMLRDLVMLDKSILLMSYDADKRLGQRRVVHVWWGGLKSNGGLMLLLAFLITAHHRWRNAEVTVLTVVDSVEGRDKAEQNLRSLLEKSRIEAKPRVILRQGRAIADVMFLESERADLAIVGIGLPQPGHEDDFFARMNVILEKLPSTLMVHSARSFDGEPVLFDS